MGEVAMDPQADEPGAGAGVRAGGPEPGRASARATRCGRGTASRRRRDRSTAPGGSLAPSPSTTAPGATPRVRAMIDYQAVGGGAPLGFAYDDVPFEA